VDGIGCALVSGAASASLTAELERATESVTAALGPTVPRGELASSWALAKTSLRAAETGAIGDSSPIVADRHLAELLIFDSAGFAEQVERSRLSSLEELTPAGRTRMEETALAFVQHGGNAAAMARALHLHPQTIRYRLSRLRELFGDQLEDADARFELEVALRSARARRTARAARG
jgi:DNA-binding PucR family transcriptional regulator